MNNWRWRSAVVLIILCGVLLGALTLWNHLHPQHKAKVLAVNSKDSITAELNQKPQPSHWTSQVNSTAIPLGDGRVSGSPQQGSVDSCTLSFRRGGARVNGYWINSASGTWNSTNKLAVKGQVMWPTASYSIKLSGDLRQISTNDLPESYPTGKFPIASNDPAYAYDRNPNHIGMQNLSYSLPANPGPAANPGCTPLGPIGILSDGVILFNALDDAGRDAVAHETQDLCNGHPNSQEIYHYHNVPSCLRDKATSTSTLVGYALDGYGIYVERDANGNLPTNADLDVCHGRTSVVNWNGQTTNIYHYDASLEYPYTLGCFHGTAVASRPAH